VVAGKWGRVRPGRRIDCDTQRVRILGWWWEPRTGTVDCCFEHASQILSPCGSLRTTRPWSLIVVVVEGALELLHARCAAVDIGKKDLKACVRTPNPDRRRSRRQETRTFATTTNALLELRDWLVAEQVTLVVMEATGDYWRGTFYLLEDCLNVILVNAAHAKGPTGAEDRRRRRGVAVPTG
jgi:hypothetical protein